MRTIQLPIDFMKTEGIESLCLMVVVGKKIAYVSALSTRYTVDTLDDEYGYLVGWTVEGDYHAFKIEKDDTATPVLPSYVQQLPALIAQEPDVSKALLALGMILSLADTE